MSTEQVTICDSSGKDSWRKSEDTKPHKNVGPSRVWPLSFLFTADAALPEWPQAIGTPAPGT